MHKYQRPLDNVAQGKNNGGRFIDLFPQPPSTFAGSKNQEAALRVTGSDGEAVLMTITLTPPEVALIPSEDPPRPLNELPRVTALVRWGQDGCFTEAEVDVRKGTVITVCASEVTVTLRNDAVNQTDGENTFQAPPVRVGAFIGYLPYFKPSNAVRTVTVATLPLTDGLASALSVIPNFASEVSVGFAPGAASGATMRFLDSVGSILSEVQVSSGERHKIPANATSVVFVNNTGATVTGAYYVFELTL